MMNALAIDRHQRQTWTHTNAPATADRDHHQSNPARTTSLARRNLTGAHSSGPSIRVGWGCALNELAAVRRLIDSGVEERAATHLAADHAQASGAVQSFSDCPEVHLSEPFRKHVRDGSEAIEKEFASGTEPFVGAAKSYD